MAKLEATVLEATAFEAERVPAGFASAPTVVVILPGALWEKMMRAQTKRSFHYHLLNCAGYNLFDPLAFDADAFAEQAIAYCRERKVDGIFGFDCFPAMVASVVKDELKLPGPASWSVFLCCNKFYFRKEVTPDHGPIHVAPEAPKDATSVIKVTDTQYYVGTRLCRSPEEWQGHWKALHGDGGICRGAEALKSRQAFYFKWGKKHGWPIAWQSADDVVLCHTEPLIDAVGEYQAEVIIQADGKIVVSDTGDIEKCEGNPNISVFKTPATLTFTPKLKAFLRGIAQKMVTAGYKGGAMDIEFMRLKGAEERYLPVEINSRYSYMGNYVHYGIPEDVTTGPKHEGVHEEVEVRNLLNRTRLCLGAGPATLPCRDSARVAKLAAMVYTNLSGPLDGFFNKQAIQEMVAEGLIDGFGPKSVFKNGCVTEADLQTYCGYAKIGFLLMTWEDNEKEINSKLDTCMKRLFNGKDTGYLKVKVIDEDGPGPTGLAPDVLEVDVAGPAADKDKAKKACCVIA